MAIAVDSTNTQSTPSTGAANKTLTWSTIAVDTDDIIVVRCVANVTGGTGTFAAPTTTSGSTSAWTQVVLINPNASCGVAEWWAKATATGNITVTQVTSRTGVNSVGVRGTLFELSGVNTTTPVGSTDTHSAASDCTAANSNLEIQGESGNLIISGGGNWNASGNNTEDIDSTSDNGYTAVWTGTTRYESGQADYHCGHTILSANDTTTRGVLDQVSGTGAWVAAITEYVAAGAGGTDATVTPSAIATSSTVPAPTPQTGSTVSATAVATVSTLPAATAQTGSTIAASAVATVSTLPAATVQTGSTVSPAAVATVSAVDAPAVQIGSTVTPAAVATVSTVPDPTVTIGGNATVTPTAIATSSTVPSPEISTNTGTGGGEEPGVTIVANRTTYRTTGPLAHQL